MSPPAGRLRRIPTPRSRRDKRRSAPSTSRSCGRQSLDWSNGLRGRSGVLYSAAMWTRALLFAVLALAAPAAQDRGEVRTLRGEVRPEDPLAPPLRRVRVATLDGRVVAFTDREGRFSIDVPSTTAALRVSKPGYGPRHIRLDPSSPDETLIRLPRGGVIVGDVIDEQGGPAMGVEVRVRRVDPNTGFEYVPINAAAQTDDLGQFRVGSLPQGEYEV